MRKNTVFRGTGVAIVTPMKADGSVNYEKYRELVEWQIENGTDAIITCGTTGESSTLSHEEHTSVIRATIEQTKGRVPVIAGTGSNETRYCIELSEEAKRLGVDALLVVTPYYNKTSQRGLIAHYTTVADRVRIPIILYNVPSRTGVDIQPETYRELSQNPYIVAAKEANGNISSIVRTAALCGDSLDLYSGNDDQVVPMLALGGKGVISVMSNILPKETDQICERWFAGDTAGSLSMQLQLSDMAKALFSDVNPHPDQGSDESHGNGRGRVSPSADRDERRRS